jgi:uncharacterized membrane protein YfcA
MQNKPQKKTRNKWLGLINIPLQMGIVIFLFAYLGQWLDAKYPNPGKYYTKSVTLFGVFLALYNVYRQVKQLDNSE